MRKSNHRAAFAQDPRFQERIARQLQAGPGTPAPQSEKAVDEPSLSKRKPSKATERLTRVQHANQDGRKDSIKLDTLNRVLTVTFPGAKLLSLNNMLRVHDAKATALKATWFKRIEALMYMNQALYAAWRQAMVFPLLVEEIYITGESRLLDHESVSAACKPVIDAFVANGFLPDDDPKHIAQPLPYTERGETSGLIICFRPTDRPWGLISDNTIRAARSMVD
ncbi:TPA: hypothetical protein ACP32N_003172 [Pseudomonas aeruginosa]